MAKEIKITKSNKVIEARYKLTLIEQKFILMMASMIHPDDKEFKFYEIRIKEVKYFLGMSKDKDVYRKIKDMVINLNRKTLIIPESDGELIVNWVASAKYFSRKGIISFEFSQRLKPYLLQLKKEFTSYKIKNIMQIKSSYAIRIYELLKQYETIGKRIFQVNELRELLGISTKKYKLYGDFKRKIIKVAERELFEKTDIYFKYLEKKDGKKVVALEFKIIRKSLNNKLDVSNSSLSEIRKKEPSGIINEIMQFSKEYGKSALNIGDIKKVISKKWEFLNKEDRDIIEKVGIEFDEYIKLKLIYAKIQVKKREGKVSNPIGLLIDAIKYNHGGIASFKNKKEDKQKIQINQKLEELKKQKELIKKDEETDERNIIENILEQHPDELILSINKLKKAKQMVSRSYNPDKSDLSNYKGSIMIRAYVDQDIRKKYKEEFAKINERYLKKYEFIDNKIDKLKNSKK